MICSGAEWPPTDPEKEEPLRPPCWAEAAERLETSPELPAWEGGTEAWPGPLTSLGPEAAWPTFTNRAEDPKGQPDPVPQPLPQNRGTRPLPPGPETQPGTSTEPDPETWPSRLTPGAQLSPTDRQAVKDWTGPPQWDETLMDSLPPPPYTRVPAEGKNGSGPGASGAVKDPKPVPFGLEPC